MVDNRLTQVVAGTDVLCGRALEFQQLFGGLAHQTYRVLSDDGSKFVVKLLTAEYDDFGLMIPLEDILRNTEAAGRSGVGAKVLASFADVPALVLEHIEGRTLDTEDLADPGYIPRIGAAIRELHEKSPDMGNTLDIWSFLERYLNLVEKHQLATPAGLLEALPQIREIQRVLLINPLPLVPSNNDLLAKNIMDDGTIRLIDYDFGGMNDPMFDVGDVAMEGSYTRDQIQVLCDAYFGHREPVQTARAELFGIGAQYTWALLFVGMHELLTDSPDASFDYSAEADSRWAWTRARLEDPGLRQVLATASLSS